MSSRERPLHKYKMKKLSCSGVRTYAWKLWFWTYLLLCVSKHDVGEHATVRMLGDMRVRSCHSVLVVGALTTVRMCGERSSSAHVKAREPVCGVRPSPSTWVWGSNPDHLAYSWSTSSAFDTKLLSLLVNLFLLFGLVPVLFCFHSPECLPTGHPPASASSPEC